MTIHNGVVEAMAAVHGLKLRRPKNPAAANRSPGLTGAALEQAVMGLAQKYPDRVKVVQP